MRKKTLPIFILLFFSISIVHFMFSTLLTGDIEELLPLKIAPRAPIERIVPQERNMYSPKELQRIYLFEHIHKSVERAKKGATS
jgi:hypothetical protein